MAATACRVFALLALTQLARGVSAVGCGPSQPPELGDLHAQGVRDASVLEAAPRAPDAATDAAYVPKAPHCGPAPQDGGAESGVQALPPVDAGADAAPAVSALPEVVNLGGPTIPNPTLVAVTFSGDPLATELEDFVASVGCTDYWRTIAKDYGIGDGPASEPIRLAESAPSSIDSTSIWPWLMNNIARDPRFPKAERQPIYLLFYPETTTLTDGSGTSCKDFGGFHHGGAYAGGVLAYAAISRCPSAGYLGISDPVRATLASLTILASHEIFESATDPGVGSGGAYITVDANHLGWLLGMNVEVADLCDDGSDRLFQPQGFPWWVQRIWSNRAAAQGTSPCVPADTPDYFYAAPLPKDTVMQSVQGRNDVAATVLLPVGQRATIGVELVSNFASGPIDVQALDGNAFRGGTPHLVLSLDRNVGMPGEVLNLTIEKTSQDTRYGAEGFVLVTTWRGRRTVFWGMTSD
jgi:hypothetical protein